MILPQEFAPDDGNNYNGYWWTDGWIPGLVTFDTQFLRLPTTTIGSAVFYAPGMMEANIKYHGLPYDGTKYIGAVAVPFCSEIGHSVWLQPPNADYETWEGPFLVADCSRRNDLYGHIVYRDQVVEVDFDTAVLWGMARTTATNDDGWMAITGRMNRVIMTTVDPQYFDGNITDLTVWFLNHVTYADVSENRHQIENYLPPNYDGTVYGSVGVSNPSDIFPMWLINGEWIIFP
jgi:hypothetical protein